MKHLKSSVLWVAALFVAPGMLLAEGNPYSGYPNGVSYFLEYSKGSFSGTSKEDVKIDIEIAKIKHSINVDTGSRGLYLSVEEVGKDFKFDPNASYPGEIELDSSGRVSSGTWTPTTASLRVKDSSGDTKSVDTTFNVLVVTTVGAQSGRTATFDVNKDVEATSVKLVGGGTVPIHTGTDGQKFVRLTNKGKLDQRAAFRENPGVFHAGSNCGIGFDLAGKRKGTGPVEDDKNQIYNPLLNLHAMKDHTLVAGYVIKTDGIQLGFTEDDKGYAYTRLNSTKLTSDNSVPDWQTPTGRVRINGVTRPPGSVVMDSGIAQAYFSACGFKSGRHIEKPMEIYLVNSNGAVGYKINLGDSKNELNPTYVEVVKPGTGTYSQTKFPYYGQFFNTGRNVFKKFNMLYDAENGYVGVLPNDEGRKDTNVFFKANPGGFPNPYLRTRPPKER